MQCRWVIDGLVAANARGVVAGARPAPSTWLADTDRWISGQRYIGEKNGKGQFSSELHYLFSLWISKLTFEPLRIKVILFRFILSLGLLHICRRRDTLVERECSLGIVLGAIYICMDCLMPESTSFERRNKTTGRKKSRCSYIYRTACMKWNDITERVLYYNRESFRFTTRLKKLPVN